MEQPNEKQPLPVAPVTRSANKYDVTGREIFVGDEITATYFNGEPYQAVLLVTIDPEDNEVCLKMIKGNDKAMNAPNKYPYSAFPSERNGRLTKGIITSR